MTILLMNDLYLNLSEININKRCTDQVTNSDQLPLIIYFLDSKTLQLSNRFQQTNQVLSWWNKTVCQRWVHGSLTVLTTCLRDLNTKVSDPSLRSCLNMKEITLLWQWIWTEAEGIYLYLEFSERRMKKWVTKIKS